MPAPYTQEQRKAFLDQIVDRLIAGESLRKICQDPNLPDRVTLLRWMDDPEIAAAITHAREIQADALLDDMADLCAKIESGELDANAGKTVIWAKQWAASKLKPRRYGDRLDLGNADSKPFEVVIK